MDYCVRRGPALETLLCNDPSPGCWGTEEPVRRIAAGSRLPSGRTRELGGLDESSDARNIGEGDREPDSEGVIAAGVAIVHPRPGSCGRVGRVEVRQMRHLSEKGSVAGLGGGERTNGDTVKSCVSPPTAATPVCAGRPRRSSACAARGRRRGCRPAAKRPRARLPLSPHPGARARRRLCARTPTQTDRSIGKGGKAGGHRQGTLTSSQQAGLSLSPTLTLPLNRRGRP